MGVVVTFSYANWSALFPEFSNINQSQVTGPILTLAQQYCRNDGGGPICDAGLQTQLLNLMVAHVAQLLYGSTTQTVSPLVGRISDAAEGTVNVGVEMPMGENPDVAWYMQTKYGAMFYKLKPKTGQYYPRVRPLPQFNPPGFGWN